MDKEDFDGTRREVIASQLLVCFTIKTFHCQQKLGQVDLLLTLYGWLLRLIIIVSSVY